MSDLNRVLNMDKGGIKLARILGGVMKYKATAAILVAIFLIALFPISAMAAENYEFYIGDSVEEVVATVPGGGNPRISGALPQGLSVNYRKSGENGVYTLVGSPSSAGSYQFDIQVMDEGQASVLETVSLRVTIREAVQEPEIQSAALNGGTTGIYYSQTIRATGTQPLSFQVTQGSLPDGLTLNSSNGEISGTPSRSGTFRFQVTVSNEAGTVNAYFTIVIGEGEFSEPVILTQPQGTVMAVGEQGYFLSVTVEQPGAGETISYQWYTGQRDDIDAMKPISGAEASVYVPTQVPGSAFYCVKVTKTKGDESKSVYSNIVEVTFLENTVPVVAYDKNTVSVDPGEEFTVQAVVENEEDLDSTLLYQWYSSERNDPNGAIAITGATESTLTAIAGQAGTVTYYFCEVKYASADGYVTNFPSGVASVKVEVAGGEETAEPTQTPEETPAQSTGEQQTLKPSVTETPADDGQEDSGFPIWILIIGILLALAGAALIITMVIMDKKKHK